MARRKSFLQKGIVPSLTTGICTGTPEVSSLPWVTLANPCLPQENRTPLPPPPWVNSPPQGSNQMPRGSLLSWNRVPRHSSSGLTGTELRSAEVQEGLHSDIYCLAFVSAGPVASRPSRTRWQAHNAALLGGLFTFLEQQGVARTSGWQDCRVW